MKRKHWIRQKNKTQLILSISFFKNKFSFVCFFCLDTLIVRPCRLSLKDKTIRELILRCLAFYSLYYKINFVLKETKLVLNSFFGILVDFVTKSIIQIKNMYHASRNLELLSLFSGQFFYNIDSCTSCFDCY